METKNMWEVAQRIMMCRAAGGFSSIELEEIFGTSNLSEIFKKSEHDVLSLLEKWENKNKINPGDLVYIDGVDKIKALVLDEENDHYTVLDENGVADFLHKSECKKICKTGWLDSLLVNIRGYK